jgi:hypothetical protein
VVIRQEEAGDQFQRYSAMLTSAADSSLICARSQTTATRCAGNWPSMPMPNWAWASARRRCPSRRSSWSWARRFCHAGRRGCAAECASSPFPSAPQPADVAGQRFGLLVLRAAVAGKKAVIRFDDLRWHQPSEQVLDAGADGACGYYRSARQTWRRARPAALERSAPGHGAGPHKGTPSRWPRGQRFSCPSPDIEITAQAAEEP